MFFPADLPGIILQHVVGRPEFRIGHDPEHSFRGSVMGRKLGFPVRDQSLPLGVVKKDVGGNEQRVGEVETPAADPAAAEDEDVV